MVRKHKKRRGRKNQGHTTNFKDVAPEIYFLQIVPTFYHLPMVSLPHELIKGLISQNLLDLIISGDALQMYTSHALPVTWVFHNLMKLIIKLAIAGDTPGNFQYLRLTEVYH